MLGCTDVKFLSQADGIYSHPEIDFKTEEFWGKNKHFMGLVSIWLINDKVNNNMLFFNFVFCLYL